MKIMIEEDERNFHNPYCVSYELSCVDTTGRHEPKLLAMLIDKGALKDATTSDSSKPRVTFHKPNIASWHQATPDYDKAKAYGIEIQSAVSATLSRFREYGYFCQVAEEMTGTAAKIEEEFRKVRCEMRDNKREHRRELDHLWETLKKAGIEPEPDERREGGA